MTLTFDTILYKKSYKVQRLLTISQTQISEGLGKQRHRDTQNYYEIYTHYLQIAKENNTTAISMNMSFN